MSDINECRQRVCRSDQLCKNTRGGYTCIDLCPSGMTKGANGTCAGELILAVKRERFKSSADGVVDACWPLFLQTLMSAERGLISADTTRSVRTPEAATTAPVLVATDPRGWDCPASVSSSLVSTFYG